MYWEITPHHDSDYDSCCMPADDDEDHRRALEYAQERLESLWDQVLEGDTVTVAMKLCKGPMPDEAEAKEAGK